MVVLICVSKDPRRGGSMIWGFSYDLTFGIDILAGMRGVRIQCFSIPATSFVGSFIRTCFHYGDSLILEMKRVGKMNYQSQNGDVGQTFHGQKEIEITIN